MFVPLFCVDEAEAVASVIAVRRAAHDYLKLRAGRFQLTMYFATWTNETTRSIDRDTVFTRQTIRKIVLPSREAEI